jgi:uncharacterized protein (TIGR03086 family)
MPATDLGPATARTAAVVAAITDDQLAGPTPCPKYTVGDLLDHVAGLSLAFQAAATKTVLEAAGTGPDTPSGDASRLAPDWRTAIPAALTALADAWQDPAAWEGMTQAGPVEMPGGVAGLVALEEVVVHGWDLARATRQSYEVDSPTLEVLAELLVDFAPPDDPANPVVNDGTLAFGPVVPVPDGAPLLDRVVGLAGRDPAWTPTA